MKRALIIFFVVWFCWIATYFLIRLDLKGDHSVLLALGETYQEKGATASFLGNKLLVSVSGTVDSTKAGTYEIIYRVRNPLFIKKDAKRIVVVQDTEKPKITLKGDLKLTLSVGDDYREPGYSVTDNQDQKLTVNVTNQVNVKKAGIYEVVYQAQDQAGNVTTVKRLVEVKEKYFAYDRSYDQINNVMLSWWSNNQLDHNRPSGGGDINLLASYSAYFLGPSDKTIYLTFDEGSSDTYLDEIAKVLYEENVQATFFLCGNYMVTHADQVKKWVDWGHSIGNHTYHHREMSAYATEAGIKAFQEEVRTMEENYQKITGQKMDKIFRFPKGEYSLRGLQIIKDMGYRTYFWSADYLDFDQEYTKEYSLGKLMERYHEGAIYLLHPKQKGNYLALKDFIHQMRELGYEFGLVRDIVS